MNSLIHADIFFFITSIAVIGISLAVLIILLYGIKIARTLSSVAESMKKQSDEIIEDIAELRQKVKSQGEKVSTFWRFIGSILLRKAAHSFKSTSKKKAGTSSKRKHKSEGTDTEDMEQEDKNLSEDDTF